MTALAKFAINDEDRKRMQDARQRQDYDADPPRCFTCVYFKREPFARYVERTIRGRSGKTKTVVVRAPKNPRINPTVERCTFGNFPVSYHAVCNEWHSRAGERIVEEPPHE